MNWNELTVVAAEAPKTHGAVVDLPIVRDRNGHVYKLRDVSLDPLGTVSKISEEELSGAIEAQTWVATPAWPGRRDHLTLVLSESLARLSSQLKLRGAFEFSIAVGRRVIVYAPDLEIRGWKKRTGDALQKEALETLVGGRASTVAEECLRNARHLMESGSAERWRLYVVYGLLLETSDPSRLDALVELALREHASTRATFMADVAAFKLELDEYHPTIFGPETSRRSREPICTLPA